MTAEARGRPRSRLRPTRPADALPRRAHLEVGYVARAHGIRGELAVRTGDPSSRALLDVSRLLLEAEGHREELEISKARRAAREVLVSLRGIHDRQAAEGRVGAKVFVFREDLGEPGPGEYYQGDLIGLTAVDEEGRVLGEVADILETGAVPDLIIRGTGAELLIPFADEFIPVVDLQAGRLVVRPPEC
ncbi:MAG: 16S rRNA processing protein RimM [Myxococcales bacterium]|nr:16S rRNA processing protein RimM [Myxococcales bacterium]